MIVNRNAKSLRLVGYDGGALLVRYDNRGDPYRQGVSIDFVDEGCTGQSLYVGVFLEQRHEVVALRDALDQFLATEAP